MSFLYLMRHAKAESASVNSKRPLSHYGIRQIHSSAALAKAGGRYLEVPAEILHSPKERTRETAERLCQDLGWKVPLIEKKGLDPDEDPGLILEEIKADPRTLMIVGHLPFLPHLSELLVPGESFYFGEAVLRCFEKDRKGWKQNWFVEPRPPDPRKGE